MTTAGLTHIPKAAGSLPALGHLVPLVRSNLDFLDSLRAYGPAVRIYLQPRQPTVVVNDPALIRQMLVELAPGLDKGRFFEKMGQVLGGDSVVTAAGADHVRKRRQLQPAFRRTEIAQYVDRMREQVTKTVGTWTPGQRLDVQDVMEQLSLDMLAATVFSSSLDERTFRQLRHHLPVVMKGVGTRIMLPDWVEKLPIPANKRFNASKAAVRSIIGNAVAELRAQEHDTGDMLSMLLNAQDPETGEPMPAHQICSEILTLAVAGTETTASILSWLMYELAQNPEVEKRLHEELEQVLDGRPVTFDDVTRLPYTRSIIMETLRLHHTGWLVTRRTMTAIRLGEWEIPSGTELAYCHHALHRDSELFEKPLQFIPDRWLDGSDQARPLPDGAFLPFGAGKHKCIGDHFALTELTTAIATIAADWRLEAVPGQKIQPVARATVQPSTLLMTARSRAKTGQPA